MRVLINDVPPGTWVHYRTLRLGYRCESGVTWYWPEGSVLFEPLPAKGPVDTVSVVGIDWLIELLDSLVKAENV